VTKINIRQRSTDDLADGFQSIEHRHDEVCEEPRWWKIRPSWQPCAEAAAIAVPLMCMLALGRGFLFIALSAHLLMSVNLDQLEQWLDHTAARMGR